MFTHESFREWNPRYKAFCRWSHYGKRRPPAFRGAWWMTGWHWGDVKRFFSRLVTSSAFSPTQDVRFVGQRIYRTQKFRSGQSRIKGVRIDSTTASPPGASFFPAGRFVREREKVKLWRDRSEKLAKQCAMAMANGREDGQRFVGSLGWGREMDTLFGKIYSTTTRQSKGRWTLNYWWCIDSWIKYLEDSYARYYP